MPELILDSQDSDGPPSQKKTVSALSTSSLVNQSCPKVRFVLQSHKLVSYLLTLIEDEA